MDPPCPRCTHRPRRRRWDPLPVWRRKHRPQTPWIRKLWDRCHHLIRWLPADQRIPWDPLPVWRRKHCPQTQWIRKLLDHRHYSIRWIPVDQRIAPGRFLLCKRQKWDQSHLWVQEEIRWGSLFTLIKYSILMMVPTLAYFTY